ncbi:MAG: DUF4280 domain-containing protein [Oscillospiraceae bacterium]|jgi:hypothetical protein|nr:DUF4280 domain-containing protein [Oscillospiraceae bacterium]
MGQCVCNTALLQCSFGAAPVPLTVIPSTVLVSNQPAGTIMEFKPGANIPPFGMCNSPSNPATKRPPPVLFTPAPCSPAISAPWAPGAPTVLISNMPALNDSSNAMCTVGAGVISITMPGQFTVQVP